MYLKGRFSIIQARHSDCNTGASRFVRRIGILRYAGLKARLQKGLIQLYLGEWSCALSFATPLPMAFGDRGSVCRARLIYTKSTYLLGRRIANLRPAFTGV